MPVVPRMSGRDWSRRWSSLSPSTRLLCALAFGAYVGLGVFLNLFANGFDFLIFHEAAAKLAHGQSAALYNLLLGPATGIDHSYAYPPIVAVLYLPLGYLSFAWAWTLFQLLCHAALWGIALVWLRARPDLSGEDRCIGLAALLAFFPIYYGMWVGQCDLFVLLLVLSAWYADRSGCWWLAGVFLALAGSLKLFILFALPALVILQRWKWFVSAIAATALLQVATLHWVSLDLQIAFWKRTLHPLGIEAFYDNQSIVGLVHRLFTVNRYTFGVANQPHLVRALTAALTLLVFVHSWRVMARASKERGEEIFGYALLTAVLVSPFFDTHHFALLLVPLLLARVPFWRQNLEWVYGFFATFMPYVGFKYISEPRSFFWAVGAKNLIFSLPLFVLIAWWITVSRRLQSADTSEISVSK